MERSMDPGLNENKMARKRERKHTARCSEVSKEKVL